MDVQKSIVVHRELSHDDLCGNCVYDSWRSDDRCPLFCCVPADPAASEIWGRASDRRYYFQNHHRGCMRCAVLYVHGLSLSHVSAYHTLKNLRISLQTKLESQPLGAIQSKGVGELKKIFIDDIETIELLLAHAIPEGLSNFAVPAIVHLSMFFVD